MLELPFRGNGIIKELLSTWFLAASAKNQWDIVGLGLRIQPIKGMNIKVVHLLVVPEVYMKLNVDGASRGNPSPCGGGGIIRDGRNSFIYSFSNTYGTETNLVAKAMALLDSLHLVVALDLNKIMVESDSKILIDILNGDCKPRESFGLGCVEYMSLGIDRNSFVFIFTNKLTNRRMLLQNSVA
ncbi:PREDICTED: uncharacterized protein LOC104602891 [Nelumbo nucifera]|uniref:Uncharacterized protein LOC104602891 n=1 Tax=Nelumbo nucifera TaxID=4432 RepID=A0A1U8AQR8_NELNU|nr:PREDICTED: uncharacterized protein LOC104602891 [Nelumbo nucifera]